MSAVLPEVKDSAKPSTEKSGGLFKRATKDAGPKTAANIESRTLDPQEIDNQQIVCRWLSIAMTKILSSN